MRIISEILIIINYNRDYSYLKTLTNKHNIMNCYISMGFITLKYHLVFTRVSIFFFFFLSQILTPQLMKTPPVTNGTSMISKWLS